MLQGRGAEWTSKLSIVPSVQRRRPLATTRSSSGKKPPRRTGSRARCSLSCTCSAPVPPTPLWPARTWTCGWGSLWRVCRAGVSSQWGQIDGGCVPEKRGCDTAEGEMCASFFFFLKYCVHVYVYYYAYVCVIVCVYFLQMCAHVPRTCVCVHTCTAVSAYFFFCKFLQCF